MMFWPSIREACICATMRPWCTGEVVSLLVLATSAAFTTANVATAFASRTTQELMSVAIVTDNRSLVPSCAHRVLRHGVVQTFAAAALAAWRLTGIAAALVALATREMVTFALATDVVWTRTDIAATRAASATLERVAIRVGTRDRNHSTLCAISDWVWVRASLVATHAARRRARVTTARSTTATGKGIPVAVFTTEIPFTLTSIPTTLSDTASKGKAVAIVTCRHAEAIEPLRQVQLQLGRPQSHERDLFAHTLTV